MAYIGMTDVAMTCIDIEVDTCVQSPRRRSLIFGRSTLRNINCAEHVSHHSILVMNCAEHISRHSISVIHCAEHISHHSILVMNCAEHISHHSILVMNCAEHTYGYGHGLC